MALNAAEEETIESLRKWWEDNGRGLIAAVLLVVAGYGGWNAWQGSQLANAEAASDLYEEILSLALLDPGEEISEQGRESVVRLAQQLRQEHGNSAYALFGSLFSAQQQVARGDLDAAESDLRWILDNVDSGLQARAREGLSQTASLRLGRVLLAKGEHEQALAVVNSLAPGSFEPAFAELRGDVYAAMGRGLDARESYLAAQQAGSMSDALRMKLENVSDES